MSLVQVSYTDHHKWCLCNIYRLSVLMAILYFCAHLRLTEKLPFSPSTEAVISVIDWCQLLKKSHMNTKNLSHGEPVLKICWTMSMTITHSTFHLPPFLMSAEDWVEGWAISWKFLSSDTVWSIAVAANFTPTWFYSSVNEPVFLAGNGEARYQ
jgi:hypothetical protein